MIKGAAKIFRFTPWLQRLLVVVLFLSGFSVKGQTHEEIDSAIQLVNHLYSRSPDKATRIIDSLITRYESTGEAYGLGRATSFKAWILVYQTRYEESVKLGHKALKMQKNQGTDTLGIGLTYNRIGLANHYFGRIGDALKYINKALDIFMQLQDTAMIDMGLNNLGVVYTHAEDYDNALKYNRLTLEIRRAQNDFYWTGYAYLNLVDIFTITGQDDSVRIYLNKSMRAFEKSGADTPPHLNLMLADQHKRAGETEKAIEQAKIALKTSEKLQHLQVMLNSKELLSELYFTLGDYEQAYLMLADYQAQNGELDSANNAVAIAEIEEKYENAEKEIRITRLESQRLEANTKLQQSRLTTLYAFTALLMALFIFGFLYQKRVQRQKLQASELNAKIASTRLIALRSQMNPHFIFNCLNTTQNFIMASKKREAYEYLSKFSKLLRQVLENSNHTFVPLEHEVAQLRLYLELEAIRFNEKFSFDFNLDPELEGGVYEIPGMLIQPVVENAILHGVVNRDDNHGLIELNIRKLNQGLVECEVKDNGVGREEAQRIKQGKKVHYNSVAIPNVLERLKILTGDNGKINLEITDLYDGNRASGTIVKMVLPYQ